MASKNDSDEKKIIWHRLFGITLTDYFTGTDFEVKLEVDLSLKQQSLDVVIVEKEDGNTPKNLPDGLEGLRKHNLITYKSIREPLDSWAIDELSGHYVNYRKQSSPSLKLGDLLPENEFRLFAVSTRFPQKLKKVEELKFIKNGVYELKRGIHEIRIIVLNEIPKMPKNAILHLFSGISETVRYGMEYVDISEMSTLINDLLGIYQLEGIMAYTMEQYKIDAKERILNSMSFKERIEGIPAEEVIKAFPAKERIKGIPTEQVMKEFPAKERIKGIPAKEVMKAFSAKEIEAYLAEIKNEN